MTPESGERTAVSGRAGSLEWVGPAVRIGAVFLTGLLGGAAIFGGHRHEGHVYVDVFAKPAGEAELTYVTTNTIDVTPGKSFRFGIEDGRELLFRFCAPESGGSTSCVPASGLAEGDETRGSGGPGNHDRKGWRL